MRLIAGIIALVFSTSAASAQQTPDLAGVWNGTSVCLLRNTACHDEGVVYHISRLAPDSAGTTSLRVTMNKIVNGVEEDMADLAPCVFTHATKSLHCPMPPAARAGDWKFTLDGSRLDGGLWIRGGTKFRDIHVTRAGPASHD